jgi:nucleoid-associated protein YgaU
MKKIQMILPVVAMGLLVLATAAPAQAQERLTMEEWQAQLDACNQREATARTRIAELDRQIADLRSQISGLDQQISQARSDVQRLNQQISNSQNELNAARTELERVRYPESYTVVRGDCLWNIAKKDYIYNDPFQWPRIYEANKDQIKDPDLIYPQQVFKIIRP